MKLYTHPAPTDAERLAEALRELVVACEEHDAMVSRIIGHPAGWNAQYLNSARQALALHSAQAQPHDLIKTGDPDVAPSICDANGEVVLAYCRKCKQGEGDLTESCPAQPPAASVQDVSDKYHELLFAVQKKFPNESRHATALRYIQQTELATSEPTSDSQENPNV